MTLWPRRSRIHRALVFIAPLAISACADVPPPTATRADLAAARPLMSAATSASYGPLEDLGTTCCGPSGASFVVGVNASGVAAGYGYVDGRFRLLRWSAAGAVEVLRVGEETDDWMAAGINASGQIVGSVITASSAPYHVAFVWTPGAGVTYLPRVSATETIATAINDAGVVVGWGNGAWRWSATDGMQMLDGPGSAAYAVNRHGEIAGSALVPGGSSNARAVVWLADGTRRPLPMPDAGFSIALGINDAGAAVGHRKVFTTGEMRPVVWDPGQPVRDLPTLGGDQHAAYAINNSGIIVGDSRPVGAAVRLQPVVWTAAGIQQLDVGGGAGGSASSINDDGVIGGFAQTATILAHGARWSTNRAPSVAPGGPYATAEGTPVTLTCAASDPDGDAVSVQWTFSDGFVAPPGASATRTFTDDASVTATCTASDSRGAEASASTTVHANNVSPAIVGTPVIAPAEPIALGTSTSVKAAFTDPGTADTHTGNVTWFADGVAAATWDIAVTGAGPAHDAEASGQLSTGVYTAVVTVRDDDQGTTTVPVPGYAVVYDPNGGFVTGSGWIWSPAGACQATALCADASGRAEFGFVSKYTPGASVPDGHTQFSFASGDFRFQSTSYEWLVVSADRARYRGEGRVNGSGTYRFQLTAVDGDRAGDEDRFRLRVWAIGAGGADGGVVYDNHFGSDDPWVGTIIGGGQIRIHR